MKHLHFFVEGEEDLKLKIFSLKTIQLLKWWKFMTPSSLRKHLTQNLMGFYFIAPPQFLVFLK